MQVERVLTLWATGYITIASVHAAEAEHKGSSLRAMLVKKSVNKATGKEMGVLIDFDNANWGLAARKYLVSVKGLRSTSWDKILKKAGEFSKMRGRNGGTKLETDENEDDHRALFVDVSDEDEDI
jgi:hypothetical protein